MGTCFKTTKNIGVIELMCHKSIHIANTLHILLCNQSGCIKTAVLSCGTFRCDPKLIWKDVINTLFWDEIFTGAKSLSAHPIQSGCTCLTAHQRCRCVFQINLGSNVHLLQLFRWMLQHRFSVESQKTSPAFPSACGLVTDDRIPVLGWTYPFCKCYCTLLNSFPNYNAWHFSVLQ